MQYYHIPRGSVPLPPAPHLGTTFLMKIPPVRLLCAKVPTRAAQSDKKYHFGRPRGANGCQMVPKRRQKEAQTLPKL